MVDKDKDKWDPESKQVVKLVAVICLGLGVVGGGYYLYLRHQRAAGLDFAERLAHATAAAREVADDAELSYANIYYVSSTGHVELPAISGDAARRVTHSEGIDFFFRSPKLAAAPRKGQLGVPAASGNAAGAGCEIKVTAEGPESRNHDDLRVRQRDGTEDGCGESLPTSPRCSLAQVWAKAIAKGAPHDALADIGLRTRGPKRRWNFKITDWNKFGAATSPEFEAEIDDDCP